MRALEPVRGTRDLWGPDLALHRRIEATAVALAERYGYAEVATPIFEFTEVFSRTLGDTSDVVTKEMYTFADKGGESLTLRPEGTAGVARAFISNGLAQELPLKFVYRGPMFRYERPQKGRLRQFHQVGVELLGPATPLADVETVALGADLLAALGVLDRTTLEINSLGDPESRDAYRQTLLRFLEGRQGGLSADSLARLARNPLRILDSKDEGDRAIVAEAPRMTDSLNAASRDFFAAVCDGLAEAGVAYTVNPRLVRGLDYYCHTAFEFTSQAIGAQGTVLAGGRYDGLIAGMGGPATPGTGWAAGVERLALLAGAPPPPPRPLAVIPVGTAAEGAAFRLTLRLRRAGFAVDLAFAGNVARRMKRANKVQARAALLLGDDEIARGAVALRDMETGAQHEVPLGGLEERLAPYR